VELDRELLCDLNNRFGPNSNFQLIEGDIIRINLREITQDKLKIIGNLPYNISGAIVEWFIEYHDLIELAVITVQKEVAARLKASPNSRDYGALSVMAQSFFNISRLFGIPPGCFSPRPKVDSSVLSLMPDNKIQEIDYPSFRDFVRAGFAQKRKKLVNSLVSRGHEVAGRAFTKMQIENCLASLGKNNDIRAEQLSLREFLELYKLARD
jgi:16S rRNA (adenine1518-N6/adenine1519-N6)-dimethyltransferase